VSATKSQVAKGRAGERTGGRAAFSQNKWKRIWRSPTAAAKSGNRRALNQAAVSAPRGVIYVRKDFSVLLDKNWTRRGRRHHSARLLSLTCGAFMLQQNCTRCMPSLFKSATTKVSCADARRFSIEVWVGEVHILIF
jgi:hypothetical protein